MSQIRKPTPFRPMLAIAPKTEEEWAKVQFPSYLSPKYDGVRACNHKGQFQSRQNEPFGNREIEDRFSGPLLDGFDGELISGKPNDANVFRRTQSQVAQVFGKLDKLTFFVFDVIRPDTPFTDRLAEMRERLGVDYGWSSRISHCYLVPQRFVTSLDETLDQTAKLVAAGYEGGMLKSPTGHYKFGRSTINSGELIKVKRFLDADAVITGVEEAEHNDNEAEVSNLGLTKRSSAKAGKRPAGYMGALTVRDPEGNWKDFKIGTGFDMAMRHRFWRERESVVGKRLEFKYQHEGSHERPRFPVFLRMRDPW